MENNNDLPEFEEVQTANTSMDMSSDLDSEDDEGVIEIDYKNEAVFQRFARDIYESEEAGIREPLANAITACIRAREFFNVENPTIEITLRHSGDDKYLILRDNGVGMTLSLIKEVLSTVGNSTTMDDGGLSGKFGMGFLACYMLVGMDGSFWMHTHSRKEGEEPVSGIWKPGMFDYDKDDKMVRGLEEDEYGTKLVFPLADSISPRNIRKWVRKHAEWSRVPVIFTEIEDNKEIEDDELGCKTFEETYSDNVPTIGFENEYVEVRSSPEAQGRLLMLDSPIRGRHRRLREIPWKVDVRFKDENGVIIKGPNEGKTPIGDVEYERRELEDNDNFILESEVSSNDIRLPEPTGTRDSLGSASQFWRYVDERLNDMYVDKVQNVLEDVQEKEDFLNLDDPQRDLISNAVISSSPGTLQSTASNDFNVEIEEERARELSELAMKATVVKRKTNVNNLGYHDTTKKQVWQILQDLDDGDVFMGVSLNQAKADVVWDDNENNVLVSLDKSSEYSKYERLDWRKLKEVRSTTIDEFDISDEVAEPFTSDKSGASYSNKNAGKDAPDRELTIHSPYGSTDKIVASNIEDAIIDSDGTPNIGTNNIDTLVLFPSGTDRNLSDNTWMAKRGVGIANCTKMVYDYLKEHDSVYHIDDYLSDKPAEELVLQTNVGSNTLKSFLSKDKAVLVHPIGRNDNFENIAENKNEVAKFIVDNYSDDITDRLSGFDTLGYTDVVYAPLRAGELNRVKYTLKSSNSIIRVKTRGVYKCPSLPRVNIDENDVELYCKSVLGEWADKPEIEMTVQNVVGANFNSGSSGIISMLESMYDDNEVLPSDNKETVLDSPEMVLQTNKGEMSVAEAEEKDSELVYHVLNSEVVGLFRDLGSTETARVVEYIKENATYGYRNNRLVDEDADVIYAPVTAGELDKAVSLMDDKARYVTGDSNYRGSGTEASLPGDSKLYAYAKFYKWEGTPEFKRLRRVSNRLTEEVAKMFKMFAEKHDKGQEPPSLN